MKKLFTLSLVLFSTVIISQVSTTSLIAYWPFNGNANDASGNGHNGTNMGATLTADRFGNLNSAYNFNSNSYIDVPYSTAFAFGTNTDITISAWVKTSGVYNFFRFYLAYDCPDPNGGNGFQLGVDDTAMPLYLALGLTSSYNGNANMSNNLWHNLIVTFDRTKDSAKIYNNGIFLAQVYIPNSQSYSASMCNPSMLIGGERNFNNQHYWDGDIDDMRIYNRVVTAQEIGALSTEGTTGINEKLLNNNIVNVYPNPSSNLITIKKNSFKDDLKIKITNSLGQLFVYHYMDENEIKIDLSEYNSGIYFVQVSDEKGKVISVKKVMKE